MMLKGQSGCSSSGAGFVPGGASQSSSGVPLSVAFSATVRTCTPCISGNAAASANSSRACESASIEANCSPVTDGASGATATPARSAPRKTAA
jgi:hypothetical protein